MSFLRRPILVVPCEWLSHILPPFPNLWTALTIHMRHDVRSLQWHVRSIALPANCFLMFLHNGPKERRLFCFKSAAGHLSRSDTCCTEEHRCQTEPVCVCLCRSWAVFDGCGNIGGEWAQRSGTQAACKVFRGRGSCYLTQGQQTNLSQHWVNDRRWKSRNVWIETEGVYRLSVLPAN